MGLKYRWPCTYECEVEHSLLNGKGQFEEDELVETQRIAKFCIHVEQAIEQIKNYHILDYVPITLWSSGIINQIFFVCAMLTSFLPPLVSDDKEISNMTTWPPLLLFKCILCWHLPYKWVVFLRLIGFSIFKKIKWLIIIYWDLLSTGLVYTETVICYWKVQFTEFHSYLITLQKYITRLQSHMYR